MSTDRFAFAGDHLAVVWRRRGGRLSLCTIYGGLTPYAAVQAQNFHTPSYSESNLNGGGFALAFNLRSATDTRTSWAGASIVCCCSTPALRSPCAHVLPGRTTG
jgi:hypothetical protein